MKKHIQFIFVLLLSLTSNIQAQTALNQALNNLPKYKYIIDYPNKYHLQIIYSEVKNGKTLNEERFNINDSNYFYCASMVKLPAAIIALEKINSLKEKGITLTTEIKFGNTRDCSNIIKKDTSHPIGIYTIEHLIKRMLLVSDNEAFDRVIDFIGLELFNKKLQEWGMDGSFINHNFDLTCNKKCISRPISFVNAFGNVIYSESEKVYLPLKNHNSVKIGKAYYSASEKLILSPKEFGSYNYLKLEHVYALLKTITLNQPDINKIALNLTKENYNFLNECLAALPRHYNYPKYSQKEFPDNYKKYVYFGDGKSKNFNEVSSTNIVGQSYGFLSDCALLKDVKTGKEIFIAIAMYCNEDEIINDGKYDYNKIGLLFMSDLAKELLKRVS